MVKYLLALTLLISGCASVPKWSDNPADCAYETGRFDEGFGKDVVTGVAKQVTRRYICVESPQVVRLPSYLELLNLPPAEEKPIVAIYNFLDKTGQRKEIDNIASFSTAVTQGLTNATVLINRGGELYAVDSSHNNTQLTPHNWTLISDGPSEELAWTYWSQRPSPDNKEITQSINVDMAKVVRKVEDLVGEKLIYTENSNMDDHTYQNIIADIQSTLADLTTRIEALEG